MKLATILNDSGEVTMTSFVIKAGAIRYLGSAILVELIKCIPFCLGPSRKSWSELRELPKTHRFKQK